MSLLTRYIQQQQALGHSRSEAIRDLSEGSGKPMQTGHAYDIEQGKNGRRLSPAQRRYILQCCIEAILREHVDPSLTLTDEQVDALADELA